MGTLLDAICAKDLAEVECLLRGGCEPNETDVVGRTALDLAIGLDDENLIQTLLSFGGQSFHWFGARTQTGRPDLTAVCAEGLKNSARCLLGRGFDPNEGNTGCGEDLPIHAALKGHGEDIVPHLLEAGADTSARDAFARDALAVAVQYGRLDAVRLLGRDADQMALADWERTRDLGQVQRTLGAVIALRSDSAFEELFELASLDDPVRFGSSALFCAAAYGTPAMVGLLLQAKAPVGRGDAAGRSPLWAAARRGDLEIVRLLLNEGAAAEWTNPRWQTNNWDGTGPLWQAAEGGHLQVLEALHVAGAPDSLNTRCRLGSLGVAARNGHSGVVAQLVKFGFSPEGISGEIRPPVYTANLCHKPTVVSILKKAGAEFAQYAQAQNT